MCLDKHHFSRRRMAMAVVFLGAATGHAQADVTVFAAASLKTALDTALEAFETETGIDTTAAYAGSSTLARQIQLGAPADLFISASTDWMDVLEASGAVAPTNRRNLLGNALVVIAPADIAAPLALSDLPARLGDGRLAMALVTAVPAGIYGREALEAAGLWDALEPRVAQTDNARAALALVATGAAPFGVVYATDAAADPRVAVVADISPDMHSAIVYPIGLLAGADSADTTRLFSYLVGPDATEHFTAQGFAVLTD